MQAGPTLLIMNGPVTLADAGSDDSIVLLVDDAGGPMLSANATSVLSTTVNKLVVLSHWAQPRWRDVLPDRMVMLHRLDIVDVNLLDGPVALVNIFTMFDHMFPSLSILRFSNTPFPWASLSVPSTLTDFTIEFVPRTPPGSTYLGPPSFDSDALAPTLPDIVSILLSAGNLQELSLFGAFPQSDTPVGSTASSIQIPLPNLQYLVLGGNPRPIDTLINCLSVPALRKMHVVTSSWSLLRSVPTLTGQMGLSSLHPSKIATITVGATERQDRPSIYFEVTETGGDSLVVLEALNVESEDFCYMIRECGIKGIVSLTIDDRSSSERAFPTPGSFPWRTLADPLSDLRIIRLLHGTRWAYNIPDAIYSAKHSAYLKDIPFWPELRVVDFQFPDSVDRNTVVHMGMWLTFLKEAGRTLEIRLRGVRTELVGFQPMLDGFPDAKTVMAFGDWFDGGVH